MHHPAQPITPQPVTQSSTPTIRHPLKQNIIQVFVEDIVIPKRLRAINPDAVKELADSIRKTGLITPIIIRSPDPEDEEEKDKGDVLVAGAHRCAAYRMLGIEYISALLFDGSVIDARKMESPRICTGRN